MIETVESILRAVGENPLTASALAGALATVLAFVRPIARALQRAMIRRIDQAWPDDNRPDEAKVRHTVDCVRSKTLLPRSVVERSVRQHKSIPPPKR